MAKAPTKSFGISSTTKTFEHVSRRRDLDFLPHVAFHGSSSGFSTTFFVFDRWLWWSAVAPDAPSTLDTTPRLEPIPPHGSSTIGHHHGLQGCPVCCSAVWAECSGGVVWWRRRAGPARDPSRFYLSLVVLLGGNDSRPRPSPKSSTDSSQPSTSSPHLCWWPCLPHSLLVARLPLFVVRIKTPRQTHTRATHGTHVRNDIQCRFFQPLRHRPARFLACAPANGERATGFVRRETG